MVTMKQNTSSLDELLRKIDALPEKGGDAVLVSLDVTPSESTQKITPDAGTDGYNEVNVAAIQTETKTANANGDVTPSAGKYLKKVTVSVPAPETQEKSATPTESAQEITPDSGKYLSKVSLGAIDSGYVGSGVPKKASADLSVSGATVTAPAGYYASAASKSVASGTAGTPSASKGSVSNHSISITPTVTNTTGYITGGTKNGNAVTVSASELVSGSETKTANGTYDVTNLASLVVNVASSGGLPSGISAIDFGTYTLASAVTGSSTFTVPHNLGVVPDLFLFWTPSNIGTTYSELAVMRSTQFGWRSASYLNKCWYHGNSTSTVTGADSTTSYGIKTMTASNVTICPHTNSSYYWRAATYNYIAIKFG